MSTVSFSMSVSLDGYVNDLDGRLDWHRVDDELHSHFNDLDREIGCHVYGRRLYETMRYWESIDDDSDVSDLEREYAHIWQNIPKYVVSNSLTSVPEIYTHLDGDLEEEIASLAREHDDEIAIGGPTLAGPLINGGVVNELRRYVVPVVLGGGTPYFSEDVKELACTLLDTQTFGNGVIMEHYALQ